MNSVKKLLIALCLMIGTVLPSAAVSGYRGFANIEGGPSIILYETYFNIGFSTTHGYQFSDHFFLGAGVGFQYSACDDIYEPLHIPVYVQFRYDYSLMSRYSFYAGAGVGYDISHSYYVAPEFGLRFAKNGPVSLNLGVKLNIKEEYYCGWGCYVGSAPSLTFGIEF